MKVRSRTTMKRQKTRSFMPLKTRRRRFCPLLIKPSKLSNTRLRMKSKLFFHPSTKRADQMSEFVKQVKDLL